ncbi:hypothetical protein ACHQM5_006415 [Ranunculus cassubicifolius]
MVEEEEDRFFSQSREWEMINGSNTINIKNNTNLEDEEDFSVFPPSHHENLHLHPHQQHHQENRLTEIKLFDVDEDAQSQQGPFISRLGVTKDVVKMRLKLGFEIVSSKISYILSLVRARGGIRSFGSVASVTVAMVVSLWYLRWRKVRGGEDKIDRLMVLVRCQDEKISQLLHQISYLNDLLSARRSIPVLKSG